MPIRKWRHYADPKVAPLRRLRFGSILPIRDTWTPSGRTTEVFDLVRIELEFGPLPTRVPAWLYVAHASPHRGTPTIHEVITQQLNLSEVSECQIHLRASAVTLTPTH